jgi:hypothetical protein
MPECLRSLVQHAIVVASEGCSEVIREFGGFCSSFYNVAVNEAIERKDAANLVGGIRELDYKVADAVCDSVVECSEALGGPFCREC